MKRKRSFYDPYGELIEQLNRAGVDYVVIGMSGINYYAESAVDTFGTQDYDIFLKPAVDNAARAFGVLTSLGYEMSSGGQQVLEKDLAKTVKEKKTLLAVNPDGVTFELLFAVSGFFFEQMASDASIFKAGKTVIRVAKLSKLLASKEAAARSKDKLFLKRYKMILRRMPEPPKA